MDPNTLYVDAKKLYEAGQLNEAMGAFEQAHAAFVEQGDEANAATVANDLGVVYYLAGRRDDARKILQDALVSISRRAARGVSAFRREKAAGECLLQSSFRR